MTAYDGPYADPWRDEAWVEHVADPAFDAWRDEGGWGYGDEDEGGGDDA